jgi:hypothetical protein
MITFQCDAVKEKGIVRSDVECCSTCHGLSVIGAVDGDVPFIVVDGERVTVCCGVASEFNVAKHRRRTGSKQA